MTGPAMRFRLCALLILGLALTLPPREAAAQAMAPEGAAPVTLIADTIWVEAENVLTAEGAVEIFSEGRHLTASRVIYDQSADELTIDGPIVLTEGPDTVLLADSAALSPDLRDGLVAGVRVILGQQVQIAAASAQRQQGRFTDLRDTVATSCEICRPGTAPLWSIRARRIIHDEDRQRIYFQHAQFRVLDLPVAYLPALSTPAPGVDRARGFLIPSTKTSDLYGTGLRLPYFIPLGDHADLTLAPFAATDLNGNWTRTMEARYRQAFVTGEITFDGALSRDTIEEDALRGYLFGTGQFRLPDHLVLDFGLQVVRDDAYLNDYDFSSADRLQSSLGLTRVVEDSRAEGALIVFHSLREDEDNNEIPTLVGDARYDRRWQGPMQTGFIDASLIGHGHQRISTDNIDGRDMAQTRAILRWSGETTAGPGLRMGAEARAIGDIKEIRQDDRYPEFQQAVTPGVALWSSLPMAKAGADGVAWLMEPTAQFVWVGDYDIDSPNDDSTQPAFDAGNLLGFERYPGLDRVEDGMRANLSMAWKRFDPSGWTLGLTLGRVLRASATDQFSPGTGLHGSRSDWLTQVELDGHGLSLRNLMLVADDGSVTLNESRAGYGGSRLTLAAGYIWQIADAELGQDEDLSELTLDGGYQITDRWDAQMDLRRDLIEERSVRAGFGIGYQTDCVRVDLSGLRRFRSTEGAEPTYSFGLTVSLTGFGAGGGARPAPGQCS